MSTPTQKQALEEAQTKITELEGKVSAAEGLQGQVDEANNKLKAAEGERDTEKTRADVAEGILAEDDKRGTYLGASFLGSLYLAANDAHDVRAWVLALIKAGAESGLVMRAYADQTISQDGKEPEPTVHG